MLSVLVTLQVKRKQIPVSVGSQSKTGAKDTRMKEGGSCGRDK